MRGEKDDKTRLSYWFPLIAAAGLPVPKTEIIRAGGPLHEFMDGNEPACLASLEADIRIAASGMGVPFFLRTDYASAKHDWQSSCFVADPSKLRRHIYKIFEFSETCDFFGLPTDVWVVRELLRTDPAFHAFHGRMPITREFRFFMRDGKLEHVQPYWPADSIRNPDDADWRVLLKEISRLDGCERAELIGLSRRANEAVLGFWSIDWLFTVDRGWVLTDMAEGGNSYRWEPGPDCAPDCTDEISVPHRPPTYPDNRLETASMPLTAPEQGGALSKRLKDCPADGAIPTNSGATELHEKQGAQATGVDCVLDCSDGSEVAR